MSPDLWHLYRWMKKSRAYESAIAELWKKGLISGEMHLGTGEEAIVAGVLDHLEEEDALALDHRGTPPLIMRGVDPLLLVDELLGHPEGLGSGQGGHMHLFSREHLLASSGIVGASGPAGAGFALAAQHLRPGTIAVSFFGEGAMNQGMLMEALNLAASWTLPVLFVCKDDNWSITADSSEFTPGSLRARVQGLGLPYHPVDGLDVEAVWHEAREPMEDAREGGGPAFLHARCIHLEAHFLGYTPLRMIRQPLQELPETVVPLLQSFLSLRGGRIPERVKGVKQILSSLGKTLTDPRESPDNDPLQRFQEKLPDPERREKIDLAVEREVHETVTRALERRTG